MWPREWRTTMMMITMTMAMAATTWLRQIHASGIDGIRDALAFGVGGDSSDFVFRFSDGGVHL